MDCYLLTRKRCECADTDGRCRELRGEVDGDVWGIRARGVVVFVSPAVGDDLETSLRGINALRASALGIEITV